ncbi:glycosyltransferase [Marinobacter sp. S6332]|uniref:glycosyltransferase n=1 Tax=Marinobacter sp. S6332 TaxID=2926403 RepID=UPI001FF6BA91|nr:glycosyltransferase [Marinobacter sp. S6332]MCK0163980.1 glycosyltransferase [Marinobacter sp. S6332]
MTFVLLFTLLCLAVPVYVYFGYPAILWVLTRGLPDITHRRGEQKPSVALIISCYNEEGVIREKLQNALELDYPPELLRIIVVSDGSDDGTDEAVKEFENERIVLVRQEGRLGKTMGINLAMEQITADITVFSDANAMYASDAVSKLVRNFADLDVGYAVGAALYTDGDQGASARNENLYWRYELAIKGMESRLHSVVGGDGAIYAIRTKLWEPLQQQDINDFVNPLQIIAKGYRGVFDADAKCFEETAGDFDREVARKERIVNRSIRGLMRVGQVMNPAKSGVFAFEVISHKLLRWLIPLFLLAGIAGSVILAFAGLGLFQLITTGAMLMLVLTLVGHLSKNRNQLPVWVATPYYFVMVNGYAVRGIVKALQGRTQIIWNSARNTEKGDVQSDMPVSKLRVLQFITPAGFYGAERWVLALANNINRDDVICDLAVTRESSDQDLSVAEYYPRTEGQQVHYLDMNGRFDFRVVSQLCNVIRDNKIDVIHTHGYKSDILGLLAAKRAGIACVSTPHGFSGNVGFKLATFIRIGTHMLRYFDRVVPLSEELMDDMRRFKVPEGKTSFIRNGVDLKEIDAALASLPKNKSLAHDSKIIGFIGQMIPRKGIPDLIEVFDQLYQQAPDLRLQLLGDGSQRPELEQQAATLNSVSAIEFLGFRSDRLELLSNFSLFVMTSSLEGIPRCMMEAMAVGIPVVAYDIPGVDQLVEHGKTGLLAPFGDKSALAACCKQVLEDPELAANLSQNAREMVNARYSAARMAEEYEALFRELTGKAKTEPSAQLGVG